jgi:hypothetical protein
MRVWLCALALATLGCSQAEGEGWVKSDKLYIENCWNGPFNLEPNFFGANPYQNTVSVRVQRGDNLMEVSDGLIVNVDKVGTVRKRLGEELDVGLPVGVSPPGVPVKYQDDPPLVHLSLYLNDSCHEQNSTIYSISGKITFKALFSGDINEDNADDRLTDASFDAVFADPRHIGADGNVDPERTSNVQGWFRFFFQRGQPAQPFP